MKLMEESQIAVSETAIKNGHCFACGGTASSGRGEHVIPKWLQTKFSLQNQYLTLLNGTLLPYRKLTIPCCEKCNNGYLSGLEKAVQSIFDKGRIESSLDRLALGRWAAKILLGFLVKETSLKLDRKDKDSSTIVNPRFIDEFAHMHLLMHSASKETKFACIDSEFPFTLYHYRLSNCSDFSSFDISTNIFGVSIAIRFGWLGLVFVNDGGLQHYIGKKGPFGFEGATVNAAQFSELAARIHCKGALRDATHSYITVENDRSIHMSQVGVMSFSGKVAGSEETRIFREWDEEALSYAIAAYSGVDRSSIFDQKTGECLTTLFDENLKPLVKFPISC